MKHKRYFYEINVPLRNSAIPLQHFAGYKTTFDFIDFPAKVC